MKSLRVNFDKFVLFAACAGVSCAALAQGTNDLYPGDLFPANLIEVNDLLDPNNPLDLGQYDDEPPIPGLVLRNYGASGPGRTNELGFMNIQMEPDGTLTFFNAQKAIRQFEEFGFFTGQTPLVMTPNAGSSTTDLPLLTISGAAVTDDCCNSVGIGGYGFADLHVFSTNGSDPDIQEPRIGIQGHSDFWQIGMYSDVNFPGTTGLNFYYDDFTTVEGGATPFSIYPSPNETLVVTSSDQTIDGDGLVGVGTQFPVDALHVFDGNLRIEQSGAADAKMNFFSNGTGWEIKTNNVTGRLTFFSPGGGATTASFKFDPSAVENLFRVGIAAPNKVDIGGDLDVKGNLMVTGSISPDYVFESSYDLNSIEEHSALMWQNKHLPNLPAAEENEFGQGVINVAERSQGMLEELEIAHIYIGQLHSEVSELKAQHAELKALVAVLLESNEEASLE